MIKRKKKLRVSWATHEFVTRLYVFMYSICTCAQSFLLDFRRDADTHRWK